jgi:hypothetical protein
MCAERYKRERSSSETGASSMKKTATIVLIIICAVVLAIGYVYDFDPFRSPNEYYPRLLDNRNNVGNFKINPETFLQAIRNNNTNIYLPDNRSIDELDFIGPELYENSVQWSQNDYLDITRSINEHVWHDNLDGWLIYRMAFGTRCQDNLSGFEDGMLTYYKTIFRNNKIRYTTRDMIASPKYMSIIWGGGTEYPYSLFGWKNIDLNKIKITAEDALKIAEENGGKKTRLSVQNKCDIHVLLLRGNYDGWLVYYNNSLGSTNGFEVRINYTTGEIE